MNRIPWELVRRVAWLCCLLGAIWMAMYVPPVVLQVRLVDFAQDQQRASRLLGSSRQTLEQFVEDRTRDRLVQVEGQDWQAFFDRVNAASTGKSQDPDWNRREVRGMLHFLPGESQLDSLLNGAPPAKSFFYLALKSAGETRYLGIGYLEEPKSAMPEPPSFLLYPYRDHALWLLAIGILLYLLIPRPRHPAQAVVHPKFKSIYGPDLVATMLAGVFFALPFLIVSKMSDLGDFGSGWAYLTLVMWGLAALGSVIFVFAARYEAFHLLINGEMIRIRTLFGEQIYPFATLERVEAAQIYRPPRWLVVAGFVASLLNWRMLGPTLLMEGNSATGLEFHYRDGRKLTVWDALPGFGLVLQALEERKVPIVYPDGAIQGAEA